MAGVFASHPRTSVLASRVMQGIASFGYAAAASGGVTAAAVTLAVCAGVGLAGAVAVGSAHTVPRLLRNRTLWAVSATGVASLILAAQAYQQAGVATVSFLLLLVPIFAGGLGPLYGEHLSRFNVIGMCISMVGIALFAQPSPDFDAEWVGIVLALLGGLALALVWHQSRTLAARGDEPWAATASQTVVPGILGLVLVLAMGSPPAGAALAWLLVSGLGYAGNTVLRLVGLRGLSASSAALIAPASALTSTGLAFLVLHQVPDLATCIGAVVIVIGLVVAQRKPGAALK